MPRTKPPNEFRPDDSPIAWFGEMLLAVDRRDLDRAAESQGQLSRLGWRVDRRKSRNTAPRREGGR